MSGTMGSLLSKAALVDFGIQGVGWAVASLLKTEKFYDFAGSGTFLFLAYQSLQWNKTHFLRQQVQTNMIMMWAFRLGLYLVTRIMKDGHDKRFNGVRDNPPKFFIFWMLQGVWVFVTLLPSLILQSKAVDRPLQTSDYVGWTLWTAGFVLEAVADYQKSVFRNDPDNAGKFIQSGLWSISRHPNYFGEILLWFGLYISASSTFQGYEHASALSPIFIWYLLTRVSGVPPLERSGLKRYGGDPAYRKYLAEVPVLVPFIGTTKWGSYRDSSS